jgi:hypothetical protein
MTRRKVIVLGVAIMLLGLWQVVAARRGAHDRTTGMRTASGMIALMSGIGIGLYGLRLKDHQ